MSWWNFNLFIFLVKRDYQPMNLSVTIFDCKLHRKRLTYFELLCWWVPFLEFHLYLAFRRRERNHWLVGWLGLVGYFGWLDSDETKLKKAPSSSTTEEQRRWVFSDSWFTSSSARSNMHADHWTALFRMLFQLFDDNQTRLIFWKWETSVHLERNVT